ncbi:glycosyl hydrolase family 3 N terminal domain-domain-containing protein [Aspergillus welwitschiae]|uniref:Probable beta-glucosidase M n=1 Tax=Aspergillus welwitschiae TaxID=1341132 RepID=A0A3F3PWI4_9EURO|nr:glycosyl hydrolase family 3 N terminal domain-domain-containing protein [Aspergillus welwitschiae]RDH31277.1 glycosyl hydrolase family 3 N terminal domain-domain-containing protein [Aspergillus welwitschiae]
MVLLRLLCAYGLALGVYGQTFNNETTGVLGAILSNLEHYWSYGRSPPVYPSPAGNGTGDWASAYEQARALVSQMTNDEKTNLTYGFQEAGNGCAGNTGTVPRLKIPGLCFQDAGNGVRGMDMVNSYPSGLHVGASWNPDLTYKRGHYMGAEFKKKSINVALGPVVGPLGRVARGGRNWEGFSNDPYLSGKLVYETITGMQESVIASVKHLIGNEQETDRNPSVYLANASISSNIDDKTMHELYLWPFQDAVKAGVGSVMCSYNRVNNSYGCQNSKVMNGLLKTELGFQGFTVTDWHARHTGVSSSEAGLDVAMPNSPTWENHTSSLAVANGSLAQARLDDMATRILATWSRFSPLDNPGAFVPANLTEPHEIIEARDPAAAPTILQGAIEGHVLVKNTNNSLPLKKPKILSLFGYDGPASAINSPTTAYSFLQGLGLGNTLSYLGGQSFTYEIAAALMGSFLANTTGPSVALNGTLIVGGGSGANTPAYIDAPFNAFQYQAKRDDTFLSWDFASVDPGVNAASEACIIFVNEQSSEGWDRPSLADTYSDTLITNVAAKCNNTMVVIHNAGVRVVDAWIEHPNITAVIFAHVPGQDSGTALVEIMYGRVSPSGRLPYTVARDPKDYGALLDPVYPDNSSMYYTQSNFTEGVYIDYRHFIANRIIPRFEFGYGLTYTTFAYHDLNIQISQTPKSYQPPGSELYTVSDPKPSGGLDSLWDVMATISCTVTNTGRTEAAEVAQLYIRIPGAGPDRVLRGFRKHSISPGRSVDMQFHLTRRDLSQWDVVTQQWVLVEGEYGVMVGKSVLDIQLTGNMTIIHDA